MRGVTVRAPPLARSAKSPSSRSRSAGWPAIGAVKFAPAEVIGFGSARSIPSAGLFPTHYAVPASPVAPEPPPRQKRPHLPRDLWPAIAERARHASLRDLAVEYGVSHETIRAIVRRVAAPRREGLIA